MFELHAVSVKVERRTFVGPITAHIPGGSVTGVVGHNGCGKSTLLSMLARQRHPHYGEIRYRGIPLSKWKHRALCQRIAYLPQALPETSGMLVRELIALGRYPWHGARGRFGKTDRAKVDEAIELTNVGSFADRMVDMLSGGERQRVWLAMLLAQDAECLLLDEPTSALDIAHQIGVLSLVERLSYAKGISVILVLHDINMAARFCDEIIALHTGKLIARGAPEEIMTPEQLRSIYGLTMDVMRHPSTDLPVAVAR